MLRLNTRGNSTSFPWLVIGVLLWLGGAAFPAMAEDEPESDSPTLLILEHRTGNETGQSKIASIPGAYRSPQAGQPQDRLTLHPGTALGVSRQPADRVVDFFRGNETQHFFLFRLLVRYYRNPTGDWNPWFQLQQIPLVVPTEKGWRPVTALPGASELIMLTSSTVPNAEGYFPSLEFGAGSGRLAIDFWIVR